MSNTWRTATTTAETSAGQFFQSAYVDEVTGEITSFTSGETRVDKYWDSTNLQTIYKKIISPFMMMFTYPESNSPFTATVRSTVDGFNFTTIKTNAFGSNRFATRRAWKGFPTAWICNVEQYTGTMYLYRSTDNGANWTQILGATAQYPSKFLLEANGRRFIESTGGTLAHKLQWTEDDGATWTTGTNAIGSSSKVCAAYFDGKYIFTEGNSGIYVSTDGNTGTEYTAAVDDYGSSPKILHLSVRDNKLHMFCEFTKTNTYYGYGDDYYFRRISISAAPTGNGWTYTVEQTSPVYEFDGMQTYSGAIDPTSNMSVINNRTVDYIAGFNYGIYLWDMWNITSGPKFVDTNYTFNTSDTPIVYDKLNDKYIIFDNYYSASAVKVMEIGASSLTDVSANYTIDSGSVEYSPVFVAWR